jgi:hypothetical protein
MPLHIDGQCVTSLLQLDNSVYQNGQIKVKVKMIKEMILEFKSVRQMGMEIIPTDIIAIVNYNW